MAVATGARTAATRAALLDAALAEFSAHGFRRSSMDGVARRAGVARATLYAHHRSKEELFRAVVARLHEDHLLAMEAALEGPGTFEQRLVAMLEARFGRFVALASVSDFAPEIYDRHSRLCGDIARSSQERSEQLLARAVRRAVRSGEVDLAPTGLSAARVAGVLFDGAHGAKGEDPSTSDPADFGRRLRRMVRVLVRGLRPES